MPYEKENEADHTLMTHLAKLHENYNKQHDADSRGKLANLRYAMRDRLHADYPIGRVIPALEPGGMADDADRNEWRTVIAGLFGFAHADVEDKRGKSLGTALRDLFEARQNESLERRFMMLLNSDAEHLPGHLRQAISLLKAQGLALDWSMLLADASAWSARDKWAQKKWVRDYYRSRKTDAGATPDTTETAEQSDRAETSPVESESAS
jgi:CRISPR type I-E-associated protein CasB/Cse2